MPRGIISRRGDDGRSREIGDPKDRLGGEEAARERQKVAGIYRTAVSGQSLRCTFEINRMNSINSTIAQHAVVKRSFEANEPPTGRIGYGRFGRTLPLPLADRNGAFVLRRTGSSRPFQAIPGPGPDQQLALKPAARSP
jgi:hypothetical protein